MINKYLVFAAMLFAAFFVTKANAEPLEIWIYAERTPTNVAGNTYSYDVVTSEDIEEVSSVDILSSGPKGQMSSLYIRGSDSDQSLVTLNGISIKDHSSPTGTDDLGQHNFTGIGTVEIYKGPMSSLYGANAAGGVVNLISDVTYESYIGTGTGSNDLFTKEAQLSGNIEHLSYTLSFSGEQTDSISVYPNGEETDPFESENYNLNFLYQGTGGNLRFNHINENNFSNLDANADTLDYTGKWKWTNNQIDFNNKFTRLAFNNSNHKRVYTKDSQIEGEYNSKTNTFYGSHLLSGKDVDILFGTEYEKVNAEFFTNIRGPFPYTSNVDKSRDTLGVFTKTNLLVDDYVLASGIRYDTIDGFGDKITGRLGVSKNGFRSSVSLGYRVPTLYEMYGKDNYGFTGNPNLKEEDTLSYEIGYANDFSDTAIFITEETDAIVYTDTYVNDGSKSYTKGIENKLFFEVGGIDIVNNLAVISAKKSNGDDKLRRPNITNNTKFSKLVNNIMYSFDIDYYGKHKDINSATWQTINVDPIVTYNSEIKYRKNNIEIYTGLYNISNKEYQRPNGYSQLGRNWTAGFKVYF
jgi:vitamin B12 transporter